MHWAGKACLQLCERRKNRMDPRVTSVLTRVVTPCQLMRSPLCQAALRHHGSTKSLANLPWPCSLMTSGPVPGLVGSTSHDPNHVPGERW